MEYIILSLKYFISIYIYLKYGYYKHLFHELYLLIGNIISNGNRTVIIFSMIYFFFSLVYFFLLLLPLNLFELFISLCGFCLLQTVTSFQLVEFSHHHQEVYKLIWKSSWGFLTWQDRGLFPFLSLLFSLEVLVILHDQGLLFHEPILSGNQGSCR